MKPFLSCLPNQSWLRRRFFVIKTMSYTSAFSINSTSTHMKPRMPVDRRDTASALSGGASYPSLRGRSVFITGGGSGIGGFLTESFARQGCLVAFVDYADEPSQALRQKIETEGLARPLDRKTDVTDVVALQTAISEAARAVGDFQVLINHVSNDDLHNLMAVTPESY